MVRPNYDSPIAREGLLPLTLATGATKLPKESEMLRRLVMLITLLVLFAVSGAAADLVSMKLCPAKDYDRAARDCAKGKGLEGSGIQIDPSKIATVDFLTL